MPAFDIDSTPWYAIYHEIALELQKFYNIHKESSGKKLFLLLNESSFFRREESWLKNIKNSSSQSIDPIQLFISFSRSRQVEFRRQNILEELWYILKKEKPHWRFINYDGRPSPMALKIENVRTEQEQHEIWECLDTILKNGKTGLTEILWQKAISWKGIREAAFTIFLFWIDSDNFIPLDNNTHQYLIYLRYLDLNTPLDFKSYTKILSYKRIKSYTSLSWEAYTYLHKPNEYHQETPHNSNKDKSTGIVSGFKLLGLRTLRRNVVTHKILKPQTFYSFDNYYQAKKNSNRISSEITEFKVDFTKSDNLYDIEDKFKLSISAIVGKNGSGKSTLIDLILMGVYNLSLAFEYLEEGEYLNGLNFELYWMADKIYKLVFTTTIKLFAFREVKSKEKVTTYQLQPESIDIEKNIGAFFYSILINYSHYALNSREKTIDWITPLSHKNDGYKTPLVINPKRSEGNIDVNREKQLMNIRLLANLLDLHDTADLQKSFRCIEDGKAIKYFSIHLDEDKCKEIRENVETITHGDEKIKKIIIHELYSVFNIQKKNRNNKRHQEESEFYIVNKVYNIVNTYDFYIAKYKQAFDNFTSEIIASKSEIPTSEFELFFSLRVRDFFKDIKDDPSHVSIKFKQAVNFLRFTNLHSFVNKNINKTKIGGKIKLDTYYDLIIGIQNKKENETIDIIDLLPPAIFKIDFYIDDKDESSFSQASSGEYQLMSVLSSILYHIRNIDSVENQYSYRYIAIVLDEVELYFHPNMQRNFIRKLILALSKLECNIWGMHVLFATHSPFILSDIVQQKILKISTGEIRKTDNSYNSFAANIHDLLADEFFLDNGSMGAFANQQIEIAINLLNYIRNEKELTSVGGNLSESLLLLKYKSKLIQLGYWNQAKFENRNIEAEKAMLNNLIEIVGEPVIQHKLAQMYQVVFDDHLERSKTDVEAEIKQLINEYKIDPKKLI